MISKLISDDIPPQMKHLNMVIPILTPFCSLVSNCSLASPIKLHAIQQTQTIFDSISQDILSQTFGIVQSDVAVTKISALELSFVIFLDNLWKSVIAFFLLREFI